MHWKKTKIVATLGPSSTGYDIIHNLAQSGLDIARLNFSHGSREEKTSQIKSVREVSRSLAKPIAIIADLQGPKIRLGKIEGTKTITKGDIIVLSTDPHDNELPMQFDLTPFVKKDQRIFLNDGLVALSITNIVDTKIETVALNSGWVSSNKGVNIPDTALPADGVFTEKDKADAIFALQSNVEYLALSFVQTQEDLIQARQLIQELNPSTKIIVKVERKEAIKNIESIVKATDAVMVARGDLAIETKAAEVPVIQQQIIKLCRQYQKPVIVATQMLESMIENPRPTRAEVSDVGNAVLDQVDAVMLSAESASGKYPIEVVSTMNDIIQSVEDHIYSSNENSPLKRDVNIDWKTIPQEDLEVNSISSSATYLSYKMQCNLIAVATASGKTARIISAFRPDADILAITHDETTANQLTLVWGVLPLILKPTQNSDDFWEKIIEEVKTRNIVGPGEKTVMVGGSTIVGSSGAIDTIKVVQL